MITLIIILTISTVAIIYLLFKIKSLYFKIQTLEMALEMAANILENTVEQRDKALESLNNKPKP